MTDTQLLEILALIRAERAATVRNWTRYRNLRFALRNIRTELAIPKTWCFDNTVLRLR